MYEELTKGTNSIREMYIRSNYLLDIVSTSKGMSETLAEKSFSVCKLTEFISEFNRILVYFPGLAASLAIKITEYLDKDCKKEPYYDYLCNYLCGKPPKTFSELVPETHGTLMFKLELIEKHNIFLSCLQQLDLAIKENANLSLDVIDFLGKYYTFTSEDYTNYKATIDKIPEKGHKLSDFRLKMYGRIN